MEAHNEVHSRKGKIHRVLAHSYAVYLVLFLVGVSLDLVFQFKIFNTPATLFLGPMLLVLATFLIFWAQHTSRNLKKENINKGVFFNGPYCYTRNPTHWGLFFLTLSFGIIANAVFVVLSTLISFIITRFVFLDKQEKILEEKYGTHYIEYKKAVKF